MAGSDSRNEFWRFKVHFLIMLMGVSVWFMIGWGWSNEVDLRENQGEKSVSQAGIMSKYRAVEPAREAALSWAGPQGAVRHSEVESGGNFRGEVDFREAEGSDDRGALERENDALRRENFRLQERLEGTEGYGGRDKGQAASYSLGETEILEEELLGKQEEIDGLLSEKEQLEAELDETAGIANRLEEEVAELEAAREGLSAEDFLVLQDNIYRLQRENGKLADRIEELQAIIEFLSGRASEGMAVMAPSEETREVAEQILMRLGEEEIPPKLAESVLVVVCSDLSSPLSYAYGLYGDLALEANQQTDVEALMFHAYIYQINDDLSVEQVEHTKGNY